MKLIIPEPPRPPRKKIAIAPIEQTKPLSVTEVAAIAARLVENIEKVIVGKHEQVCTAVITLLAEGHLLIQDIPGVAKTMLARALAQSVGGTFNRIQCTPDLQPADILGEPFLVRETGQSEYKFGPLFANIVLVDEINRASPRTQAAMLEAMGEGLISIERVTYRMERPFMVVATQNPIEHEGTFGLPEAQLDRFLIRMSIGYPSLADERQMCRSFQLGHPIETLNPVTSPDAIMKCQEAVRTVEVEPEVCEKILERVQQTRRHAALVLGASPRGSLGLFRAAQAAAAMEGKASVSAEKVDELAEAVLAHRLLLRPELKERWNQGNDVIREILSGKSVG
ncbi:MAG TPA: MoxR family ATPase [Verrucomicrobiae bacterium]|nr:MoxR family ATPase [Verrucomicrobiae bacterium]